jgi:ABC-type transport system involved in cytochrome bd biosynthesis fused ATPase/permease subunit
VQEPNVTIIKGIYLSFAMFLFSIFQSLTLQQYFDRVFALGACIKTSIINMIYKKSLILSNNARKTSTVGQMINLISVNCNSFNEFPHHIHMVWSCILNIIICLCVLSFKLNATSAIAGLITMAIFIPFNLVVTNKSKKLQTKKLKIQDNRIKTVNEILNGIKIIKFMTWEISFEKIVSKIRDNELKILKSIAFMNSLASLSWTISPFLVFIFKKIF